jgi:hypothetical protein
LVTPIVELSLYLAEVDLSGYYTNETPENGNDGRRIRKHNIVMHRSMSSFQVHRAPKFYCENIWLHAELVNTRGDDQKSSYSCGFSNVTS